METIVFYLRTNRNMTADEITRTQEQFLEQWENEKGLTRILLPESWKTFKDFIPHLDWDRPREQRGPLELKGGSSPS